MDKPWSEDLYNKRKLTQAEELRYLKEVVAKQVQSNPSLIEGVKPIEQKNNSIAHAKELRKELGKYPIFSSFSRVELITHCPTNNYHVDSIAAFPNLSPDEGYHFCNYDKYKPEDIAKSIKKHFLEEYKREKRPIANIDEELTNLTNVANLKNIRFPIIQLRDEDETSNNVYYDPIVTDKLKPDSDGLPPCYFVFFKLGEQVGQDSELSSVATSLSDDSDMMMILGNFISNCTQWRYGPKEMKRYLKNIINKKRLQLGVPITEKHTVEDLIMLILQNTRKILPHEKAMQDLVQFKRSPGEKMSNCVQRLISLYKISKKKPDISVDPNHKDFNDTLYYYVFGAMAKLQTSPIQRRDTMQMLANRNHADRAIWPTVMEYAEVVDTNEAKFGIRLSHPLYLNDTRQVGNFRNSSITELNNIWEEATYSWETPNDEMSTEDVPTELAQSQNAFAARKKRAMKFSNRMKYMKNPPNPLDKMLITDKKVSLTDPNESVSSLYSSVVEPPTYDSADMFESTAIEGQGFEEDDTLPNLNLSQIDRPPANDSGDEVRLRGHDFVLAPELHQVIQHGRQRDVRQLIHKDAELSRQINRLNVMDETELHNIVTLSFEQEEDDREVVVNSMKLTPICRMTFKECTKNIKEIIHKVKNYSGKPPKFEKLVNLDYLLTKSNEGLKRAGKRVLDRFSENQLVGILYGFYHSQDWFLRDRPPANQQARDLKAISLYEYLTDKGLEGNSLLIYGYAITLSPAFIALFGDISSEWVANYFHSSDPVISLNELHGEKKVVPVSRTDSPANQAGIDLSAVKANRIKRHNSKSLDRSGPRDQRRDRSIDQSSRSGSQSGYRSSSNSRSQSIERGRPDYKRPVYVDRSRIRPRSVSMDYEIFRCRKNNCPGTEEAHETCLKCGYNHPTHKCYSYYVYSEKLCTGCEEMYHSPSECKMARAKQPNKHPKSIPPNGYVPDGAKK